MPRVISVPIGTFQTPPPSISPYHLVPRRRGHSSCKRGRKMTRGNQREIDRQRAQTRKAQVKQRDDGLTPEQRRERDAKALQEKAAKKAAGAAAGGAGATDSKNKGNAKK